jgi:hypothetical protein
MQIFSERAEIKVQWWYFVPQVSKSRVLTPEIFLTKYLFSGI